MKREDITSALAVGSEREICVLMDRPTEIPGYVRLVTIHPGNSIQIAYEVEGIDEGGAYFWGTYASLDDVIGALEAFLGKPLREWTHPHLNEHALPRATPDHGALAAAIRTRSLVFPRGAEFKLKSPYWEQFLFHGNSNS